MWNTLTSKYLSRHSQTHHESRDATSVLWIMIIFSNKMGCAIDKTVNRRRRMAEGRVRLHAVTYGQSNGGTGLPLASI